MDPIRVLINGIGGQMGKALLSALSSPSCGMKAVGGVDPFCDTTMPVPVFRSASEIDVEADAVIDFSVPEATEEILAFCLEKKLPLVVCTTALSDSQIERIQAASMEIPIFRSGNMSLGINLMCELLKRAKLALKDSFDIEIIETHHNRKKDAPSGTALMLAEALHSADGEEHAYRFGRSEKDRRREPGEIGFHSIRGGTIVGEHEVRFLGDDEEIAIRHAAYSKRVFANGAIRAAAFLVRQKNGLYSMDDLVAETLSKSV